MFTARQTCCEIVSHVFLLFTVCVFYCVQLSFWRWSDGRTCWASRQPALFSLEQKQKKWSSTNFFFFLVFFWLCLWNWADHKTAHQFKLSPRTLKWISTSSFLCFTFRFFFLVALWTGYWPSAHGGRRRLAFPQRPCPYFVVVFRFVCSHNGNFAIGRK